ncbi:MAG: hypothetical protein QM708_10145 [Propioniciclava sp.]|uniref:hypothetical protein n=1 Tax=Propioniciclava sp. TaxID=2038686 RepID=UPI0039E3C006
MTRTQQSQADKIRASIRLVWIGPAAAIAWMTGLFAYALTIESAALMVAASSAAAMAGTIWASVYASMKVKLARMEQA